MIAKWKKILDIDLMIFVAKINDEQVVYPDDLDVKEFVGISIEIEDGYATIYHSRPLTEEDIVHELLHAKNPEKSEAWVNKETERLIKKC